MPPKLTRAGLLKEADTEYQSLQRLLARVPKDEICELSVNSGGWTLKDVLAHIADWAERCEQWCEAGLRGEEPSPPAPGFKWNETPRLNHEIFLKRRGHSLMRVRRDFRTGHEGLARLVTSMDESDLCEPRRFIWCGPTWSVGKHIKANTASHYRWASKHCRRLLAAGKTVRPKGQSKQA